MSKHTPGPWRAGTWGASVVSDQPIQDGINGSDDIQHYGGHLVAESIAACNMPLIIAAPELLESLTNLVGLAKLAAARLDKYHAALAHAEAVIAKARGAQ